MKHFLYISFMYTGLAVGMKPEKKVIEYNYNDAVYNFGVRKSLFKQLVVQASMNGKDQKPFQELIDRIKEKKINLAQDPIPMTEKDMECRLLPYIKREASRALKSIYEPVIINSKRLDLTYTRYDYSTSRNKEIKNYYELCCWYDCTGSKDHTTIVNKFHDLIR